MKLLTTAFSLGMLGIKEQPESASVVARLRISTLLEDDLRGYIKRGELISAIGHEGTAALLSARLGIEVRYNRIDVVYPSPEVGGLIVAQLTERVDFGRELSAEEVQRIGIVFFEIDEWRYDMAIPGLGLGRIVHYVNADREYAAIISEVHDAERGLVSLHVLVLTGLRVESHVLFNEQSAPHSWHWPPRV